MNRALQAHTTAQTRLPVRERESERARERDTLGGEKDPGMCAHLNTPVCVSVYDCACACACVCVCLPLGSLGEFLGQHPSVAQGALEGPLQALELSPRALRGDHTQTHIDYLHSVNPIDTERINKKVNTCNTT